MRLSSCVLACAVAGRTALASGLRDYSLNDYFAIQLDPSASPDLIAQALGARLEGPLGELPHHYTFSSPKQVSSPLEDILHQLKLRRRRRRGLNDSRPNIRDNLEGVLWSQKQVLRQRLIKRIPPPPLEDRQGLSPVDDKTPEQLNAEQQLEDIVTSLDIEDPIFREQWHLFNPLQLGHDLNVTGLWMSGITGNGTIAAVVDDGLDMYSDDLKPNYFADGSYDFNEHTEEPRPRLSDDNHGTRCAGEIAAARNTVCGVGVAYDAQIAGIRILSKPISDEDEASAINYKMDDNDIYSCSWGPPDDGRTMEGPGILIKRALVTGVQQGRRGRGSVFVFAAGNGAASEDNCNFDGYTNSIYSITVGGIDRAGNHPYYSEKCSAQLVVTYSSGNGDAIHTTDVGVNKCFSGHGGTSAAGPLVVGVVALALSVRPELTWRDLQYLCVGTAVPIHLEDGEWQDTTIGKKFSHTYGYGKIDAGQYVEAAKTHELVKPQAWFHSPWLSVQHPIPQGAQGLATSFEVTKEMLQQANLERLEHVTVTMNIDHARRGDLSVELRSPDGLVSHIATTRRGDLIGVGYVDWTFMSVVHWGESGVGTWTVIAKDTVVNEFNGTFIDWRLNLWGESIDASIQEPLPLPDEHDDDHVTASAVVSTTSIEIPTTSELPASPSDHIDRPIKPTPSDTPATTTDAISTTAATTTPVVTTTTSSQPSPTHTPSESFLPSFFPTFGVSKRTQIWIYGSLGLIVAFFIALGVYFYVQRKKRLRSNPRDDYEFEILDDEEDDIPSANGQGPEKKPKRRAAELYDAFAGESDEDLFSDGDEDRYEDNPASNRGHRA